MRPSKLLRSNASAGRCGQRGLTLVELMVAVTLGILVAGAAVAALLIARQGFSSTDAASQLRENARYAAGLIERVAMQSGFQNAAYNIFTDAKLPGIRGYDNSLFSAAGGAPASLANNTRTTGNCGSATGTACLNKSDVLVVRFSGASRVNTATADDSMINCAGISEPELATGADPNDPRAYSIFHVATGSTAETDAEPSLACTYWNGPTATFVTTAIVKGVEGFQVLYGVFGVPVGSCSGAINYTTEVAGGKDAPSQFLTASQMDPAGYCANNWSRVRALRIGLLVRGDPNTAVDRAVRTWPVLGEAAKSATIADNELAVAGDGRLRQQLVFTVYLRNAQFAP